MQDKKKIFFMLHIVYAVINAIIIPKVCLPIENVKIVGCETSDKIMFLSITYLFVFLCIYILWNYIPYMLANKIQILRKIFFCFVFFLTIQVIMCYPYDYISWGDSAVVLGVAQNGYPLYWHNYMTSVYVLAINIVFGSPIFIGIVQGVMYAYVVSFICARIYDKNKYVSYFILSIFVAYSHFWGINPYRIFVYGILLMYLIAKTVFEIEDGVFFEKKNIIVNSALAGFLAFFRTESILYIFFVAILMIAHKKTIKKLILTSVLISCLTYIIFFVPQSVGNQKYYKNDYLLISVYGLVSDVLYYDTQGDSLVNTGYRGAQEDINGLIIERDKIEQYGSYVYHYWCGVTNNSTTQSDFSDDERKSIIKSAFRLCYHNIPILVRERICGLSWIFHTNLWESTPHVEFVYKNCRDNKEYNDAIKEYVDFGGVIEQKMEKDKESLNVFYLIDYFQKEKSVIIFLFIVILIGLFIYHIVSKAKWYENFIIQQKKNIILVFIATILYLTIWNYFNLFHIYILLIYVLFTGLFVRSIVKLRKDKTFIWISIYTLISFTIALFFCPFPDFYYFSPTMECIIIIEGIYYSKHPLFWHNKSKLKNRKIKK